MGRLAGAVAGEMLKDQQVAMDACGPKAQLTALKARGEKGKRRPMGLWVGFSRCAMGFLSVFYGFRMGFSGVSYGFLWVSVSF